MGLRHMERIQTYYSAVGVRTLFKHHPELEEHLMKGKDDKLVAAVGPPPNHPHSQASPHWPQPPS
jgi:hypothetical protein